MAGARPGTALSDVCDLLTVVAVEQPLKEVGEVMDRWRGQMHQQLVTTTDDAAQERIDRDTWGLLPHQQAATRRLTGRG
jgi:hypothetical protein